MARALLERILDGLGRTDRNIKIGTKRDFDPGAKDGRAFAEYARAAMLTFGVLIDDPVFGRTRESGR